MGRWLPFEPRSDRSLSIAVENVRRQAAGEALLHRVATRGDLMCLRFQDEKDVWRRLLDAGTSSSYQDRLASQQCALQALLTPKGTCQYNRMSAAACRMRAPGELIRAPKV